MTIREIIFLSFLLTIIQGFGQTSNEVGDWKGLRLDSSVRYGKLSNGFTYYLKDNDSESAQMYLVVKAGRYHQDSDQLEYAHLLEHMGANYTKNFPDVDLFSRNNGRYSNANTENASTGYYLQIPSRDGEGIMTGVELLRDWAQDIFFDDDKINTQRNAVLGEGRVNDPYQRRWIEKVDSVLVSNTGLTNHSDAQRLKNLKNFNRKALLRFYNDWYRPDLEAAIIVGDINLDSLVIKIRNIFSDLKMPSHPRTDAQDKLDNQNIRLNGENRFITLLDTLKPKLRLEFFSKRKNRSYAPLNISDFKLMLLQDLCEQIIRSRGQSLMRQYSPPFTNFWPDLGDTAGDNQLFVSGVGMDLMQEKLEYLEDKFKSALISWKRIYTGIRPSELDEAKKVLSENYDWGNKDSKSLALKYRHHFVSGMPVLSPEKEREVMTELLNEISLEDIQEFTSDYGDLSKNMDFIFVSDGNKKIPDENTLKEWLSEVIRQDVEPLEQPEPAIGSLVKTVRFPDQPTLSVKKDSENVIGINTINFNNGTKLILKPVKLNVGSNSNTIQIRAFRPNRAPLHDRKEYVLAQIIPEVTEYMGADSYDKFELEKFKRDKDLSLRFTVNRDYQLIEGSSKTNDIEELLSLIYLYIGQPRNDPKALEGWKSEKLEIIKDNSSRGSSEFYMKDIQDLWYPEIPNLSVNDIENLTLEKIAKGRKKWFSDFSGYTFIVTGDFDTEKLKPVLINYVSKLPFKDIRYKGKLPDFQFPFKKMDDTIRLKNLDQVYVRLYFPVKVSTDVKTQVELKLIGKALGRRIHKRLRDGCYAPRASGEWQDRENGIYSFFMDFDTELGDEDRMLKMAMEEFTKLREEGVDQSWLEREIKNEQIDFNRKINSFSLIFNYWSDEIQQSLENNTDLEEVILKYEPILKNFVSLEEVNEAAKRYLTKENFQKFLILPEGYKKNDL